MIKDRHVKVILPEVNGDVWMGGKLYFENLTKTVGEYYPDISFTSYQPAYQPKGRHDFIHRIKRKVSGVNFIEELNAEADAYFSELAEGYPSVIFSNYVIPYKGLKPYIFWIPDFQFLHLPEFATADYIQQQKKLAREGASKATLVMLSSNDALIDFRNFSPENAHKGRVVQFVKTIPGELLTASPSFVLEKYQLPEHYFYVPNQFWKHKNHILVLQALKELKQKGIAPFVVFSGNVHDFRNPGYFNELLSYISQNGIRNQVAFLGMIPYGDVIALIRQSVAVINPSLFEGWSTTVEEVKSIGKRMILSDIGVHKEQAPDTGVFFRKNDSSDLADSIKSAMQYKPGPDLLIEKAAQEKTAARRKEFAGQFVSIIKEALSKH